MGENEGFEKVEETKFDNLVECESFSDELRGKELETIFDEVEIPAPYAGMPAEILLLHSRKKVWVIGRFIGWMAVLTTFACLIGLSITIIVKSPPCLDFWEQSPIYQIYPRSFKDCTDPSRDICNDGIGDIPGIIEQIDYLSGLGIKIIRLNSIYDSPQQAMGHDVADYRKLYPVFGNDKDIEGLINEMHKRGMKLLLDFIPNHTSDQHALFKRATENQEDRDLYIWHDGLNPDGCEIDNNGALSAQCNSCNYGDVCPNNWQSVLGKETYEIVPAWTFHPTIGKYYYRVFSHFQPDLNLRQTTVVNELNEDLSFWMEKGVDGFYFNSVGYSLEHPEFRDEQIKDSSMFGYWHNLYHDYTFEYSWFHDVIMAFRKKMDKYSTEPGVDMMMITESDSDQVENVMRYYGVFNEREADFPMNFGLIRATPGGTVDVQIIKDTIRTWMINMPKTRVPNWVISSDSKKRFISRLNISTDQEKDQISKLIALLIMTLPGTPFIYYGQEIGMTDLTEVEHPKECFVDPINGPLDYSRSPMRWKNETEPYFGFSNCTANPDGNVCNNYCTWLPVGNETSVNVQVQETDSSSVLSYYKWLIKDVRVLDEFTRGELCINPNSTSPLLHYYRRLKNGNIYEVVMNWSDEEIALDISGEIIQPPSNSGPSLSALPAFTGVVIKRNDIANYNPMNLYNERTCFQRLQMKYSFGGLLFTE